MSRDAAPPTRGPQGAVVTAVTSGKGGVGKTLVSANLAAALARAGQRVTLHDVFTGKATLDEAIQPAPGGFSVLLAGSGLVEYSRMTPEVRDKLLDLVAQVRTRSLNPKVGIMIGGSAVVRHPELVAQVGADGTAYSCSPEC